MRRSIALLVVALVAGAATTIAAAWGAAALSWSQPLRGESAESKYADSDCYQRWRVALERTRHVTRVTSTWSDPDVSTDGSYWSDSSFASPDELLPGWARFVAPTCGSESGFHMAVAVGHGWPLVAMCGGEADCVRSGAPTKLSRQFHTAVALSEPTGAGSASGRMFGPLSTRLLPLAPVWPGFLINSFVFALVIWLMFSGTSALVRLRRFRRGMCPKCGYAMFANYAKACPECGWQHPVVQPERSG